MAGAGQESKEKTIKKLKKTIKEKDLEIETLSQISKVIVSGQYMEEILNLVVTITAEKTGSKICSIMLLDEAKKELKIIATQSLSKEYRDKPAIRVGQSVSGKAVQTKKPVAVPDVTKDKDYMYADIAKKEGLKSMLAVPMEVRGRVIGVINVYTSVKHKFSPAEIRILASVANQAAISIENMNMKEEVLLAKEALETRKIIERAKGILMKRLKLSEDGAYRTIHKKSMDSRKSMKEVADAILLTMTDEN
ncbi:MAG: GAF domain-containing protein [Candidatus Goldiibacteriota bacterium]